MAPRRRSRLLVIGVVCGLSWLAAEGAWKLWSAARLRGLEAELADASPWFAEDPILRHRFRPGVWQAPQVWGWAGAPFRFSINRQGLRGPELAVPKPEGMFRILCLGGSTTFGTGCPADSLSYPARLEQALRRRFPGRPLEVLNAGVPGYTTAESLLWLRELVEPLRPDLVVVYHAVNDLAFAEEQLDFYLDPTRVARPLHRLQRARSDASSSLLGALWARSRPRWRKAKHGLRERLDRRVPSAFRANLERIVALAARHGARTALVSFALQLDASWSEARRAEVGRMFELSWEGLTEGLARLNAELRAVAARPGVVCCDVAPQVPAEPALWVDPAHLNPRGSALFAERVAEVLAPELAVR